MKYVILKVLLLSAVMLSFGCGDQYAVKEFDGVKIMGVNINSAISNDSCPIMGKVLKQRNPSLYNKEIIQALAAITIAESTLPVGSYMYAGQKYPGDIDIFEAVSVELPKEQAQKYYAMRLSNMATRVKADPDIFLGDFKAGLDSSAEIDIGSSKIAGEFSGYDREKIKLQIEKLSTSNIISEEEYNNLLSLAVDKPDYKMWYELKNAAHNLVTMRWTLNELIDGKKKLRNSEYMSLHEAIDDSLVKIDVWAPVTPSEGYTEVTNFFYLSYEDKGKVNTLVEEMPDYKKSITKDVLKYSEKSTRNSLKAAKRLWVLSTILKDNEITKKILPLMSSPAAALNQIIAESEVVRWILESDKPGITCFPVGDRLTRQILSFEKRILNNTNNIKPQDLSNSGNGLIRSSFEILSNNCSLNNKGLENIEIKPETRIKVIANLNKIEELIKPIVEKTAANFLNEQISINLDDPLSALTGNVGVCPLK